MRLSVSKLRKCQALLLLDELDAAPPDRLAAEDLGRLHAGLDGTAPMHHHVPMRTTSEAIMKTLSAKVLDPMHLELSEPLPATSGERVQIAIAESSEDETDWQRAAEERFLSAYDDQDAIYDDL